MFLAELLVILINTLKSSQNSRHLPDDIFKCIFLNENVSISIKISLKFVLKGPINNIPALVQIMVWFCGPGDKPLSEPMMYSTDACVTRPQWFKPMLTDWISSMIITRDPCWTYVMSFHTFSTMCPSDVIFRHEFGSALSDGTKPFVEPKLTNQQWSFVPFAWGHFHKRYPI